MVFLVNDRLGRVADHRHTAEGHLAVAAIEGRHQPFFTIGIASNNRQLTIQIDACQLLTDMLIQRYRDFHAPAGKVDEAGVHAIPLEQMGGIPGTVNLPDTGQHFAHSQQVIFQTKVAVLTQAMQIVHAALGFKQATIDKGIGLVELLGIVEQLGVNVVQHFADTAQRFAPQGLAAFLVGEQRVDAGVAVALVLQEQVRNAAVGRHHENATVKLVVLATTFDDIVAHGDIITHRGAADFFYTV